MPNDKSRLPATTTMKTASSGLRPDPRKRTPIGVLNHEDSEDTEEGSDETRMTSPPTECRAPFSVSSDLRALRVSVVGSAGSWVRPSALVLRAVLLAGAFGAVHALGWREHTTFLSGTPASTAGTVAHSGTLGLIYLALWFGFVLGTPILLIAGGLLSLGARRGPRLAENSRDSARPT